MKTVRRNSCTTALYKNFFTFYMVRKHLQIPVTINMDDVPRLTLIESTIHNCVENQTTQHIVPTYIIHITYYYTIILT